MLFGLPVDRIPFSMACSQYFWGRHSGLAERNSFSEKGENMHTCDTNREDTENNRRVDLTVTYEAVGDTIRVKNITPTRVTFLCPQSRQPLRTIHVHREIPRSFLVRQLNDRGCLEGLEADLFAQHASIA
ncbi:MAG: hypothetical protein R3E01_25395 [Pirellulaceae bacterium]|nr:hypothetical protein [Planctomycetales bacterium]